MLNIRLHCGGEPFQVASGEHVNKLAPSSVYPVSQLNWIVLPGNPPHVAGKHVPWAGALTDGQRANRNEKNASLSSLVIIFLPYFYMLVVNHSTGHWISM